jgi:triosephosphate isomerase
VSRFRTPVIAGNWKMFKGPSETAAFFAAFLPRYQARQDRSLIFFPPAICLAAARAALVDRPDIALGVQNIHWEKQGAFTGETAAPMAADAGARLVLIGHSERRHVFGETDEQVGRKIAATLAAGLTPVVCVGEKLDERQGGQLEAVLSRQLDAALAALTTAAEFLLAYEPVWAIGTGVNATPDDASAAHAFLRGRLRQALGAQADQTPILYGGSVKPDNAGALLAAADVDGLLVGGASLDPEGFATIAAAG